MIKRWRVILAVSFLVLLATGLHAEGLKKLAQTSMKWLSIPVGARSMAMGTAYYCMSGSAGDVFWNPAGVGFVERPQVFVSNLSWIVDVNQYAGAVAVPVFNFGVVSFSARLIDFGSQEGTIRASNEKGWEYTEPFSPNAYQVGLGFMQKLSNQFSWGAQVSFAAENMGTAYYAPILTGDPESPEEFDGSMGVVNVDFGVIYYTGLHDLRIAMTLRNFSQEKGYGNVGNPIPMDWRFGMAMNVVPLFLPDLRHHALTISWDLSHPRDYTERLHFGTEYVFMDWVALRAGYKTNYDTESFSYGAGILPHLGFGSFKFGIDYAFVPFDVFGSVQTFSVSMLF